MPPVHHDYPRSRDRHALALRCAGALAALLTVLLLAACSEPGAQSGDGKAAPSAFPGSATSLEALSEGVLRGLARGDVSALEGFRLAEGEHNQVVWPELPASAPEVNFPVDLAWTNIQSRNRSAIARLLPLFEGREPSLRGVGCRGITERFETFSVLTDCWVTFDMDDSPGLLEAQLFKDVLSRGGGHKVFRYYDEEPRAITSVGG